MLRSHLILLPSTRPPKMDVALCYLWKNLSLKISKYLRESFSFNLNKKSKMKKNIWYWNGLSQQKRHIVVVFCTRVFKTYAQYVAFSFQKVEFLHTWRWIYLRSKSGYVRVKKVEIFVMEKWIYWRSKSEYILGFIQGLQKVEFLLTRWIYSRSLEVQSDLRYWASQ